MHVDGPSQIGTLVRWWKVIFAATVAAGLAGLGTSAVLPSSYEASSTLLVGEALDPPELNYDQLQAARLEAQTFAILAGARSTLQETIVRRDLELEPEDLRERLTVEAPTSSRFVRITVADESPWVAADTANAIAATLLITPVSAENRRLLASLESEIADLSSDSQRIEAELASLRAGLTEGDDDDGRIRALEQQLNENQLERTEVLAQISALSSNALFLADPAARPAVPTAPRPLLNAALAAVTGMVMASGIALVTDRVRKPYEA